MFFRLGPTVRSPKSAAAILPPCSTAIEDEHGSRMADIVFEIVRSIGNWVAGRDDDYASPFNVRGQRRSSGAKRSRILDDDELRKVWKEADGSGSFGALIKTLLLTGQRRGAVLGMRWSDISDGTWTIASEAREKINAGSLKLPAQVLQIINAQPRLASDPFVFAASRGNGPMNGFSRAKFRLTKSAASKIGQCMIFDDAAGLDEPAVMCRARYAEAHVGACHGRLEGRYDVHQYDDEKAVALAKLAALVDGIVDPDSRGNVVPMQTPKRKKIMTTTLPQVSPPALTYALQWLEDRKHMVMFGVPALQPGAGELLLAATL